MIFVKFSASHCTGRKSQSNATLSNNMLRLFLFVGSVMTYTCSEDWPQTDEQLSETKVMHN